MIKFDDISTIYMGQGYTDLRKGIDGYSAIVQSTFHLDSFDDALFIFYNRQRNKLKCQTGMAQDSGYYISDWKRGVLNGKTKVMAH